MRLILALLFACLVAPAAAQTVRQSGVVTPGQPGCWVTSGVLVNCGTPATPLSSPGYGIVNNSQTSIAIDNNPIAGPYNQFGFGVDNTAGWISLNAINGATALPLNFRINGVTYPFSTVFQQGTAFYATQYGVVADGVTSNDVFLQNAINACAAVGGKLYLPYGTILLTGTTTTTIKDCYIVGAGPPDGTQGDAASVGTMITLTSTSTVPFIVKNNWGMEGVNFYYPNAIPTAGTMQITQTGTTLTVASLAGWTLAVNDYIVPSNAKYGPRKITGFVGGSGGNGTYTVSVSETISPAQSATSTRITAYPALFQCGAANSGCAHFRLRNVNVINGYDVFSMSAANGQTGAWTWTDSEVWACDDAFKMYTVGDTFHQSAMHYSPGQLLAWLNFSASSETWVDACSTQNRIFHVLPAASFSADLSFMTFAWRYGFLIDNTGNANIVKVSATWDGTGTIIDASSGGVWQGGSSLFNGTATGGLANYLGGGAGNAPMFNMGGASALYLSGFTTNQLPGDFADFSGGIVNLQASAVAGVGGIQDGADYYLAKASGGNLVVSGSVVQGIASNTHSHGIYTSAGLSIGQITGNYFINFNDDIDFGVVPTIAQVVNNASAGTTGTASMISPNNSGFLTYSGNRWDKPPTAAVTSCGSGASVSGGYAGTITVGSTTPTTSCQITLPFPLTSANQGTCVFTAGSGVTLSQTLAATNPTKYTLLSSADMHGTTLTFNCSSEQ